MYYLVKFSSGNLYLTEHLQSDLNNCVRVIFKRLLYRKNPTVTLWGQFNNESVERIVHKKHVIFTSENIEDVLVQATIEAL